ncbi:MULTISPECIES: type I toxin-antitoxin system Fst family toxin [Staphylococcus]|nr:type I toxin-antitoxin system Fst family toxin [Staphylococcus pettenkoferi]
MLIVISNIIAQVLSGLVVAIFTYWLSKRDNNSNRRQ